jgi:hypothetical protein
MYAPTLVLCLTVAGLCVTLTVIAVAASDRVNTSIGVVAAAFTVHKLTAGSGYDYLTRRTRTPVHQDRGGAERCKQRSGDRAAKIYVLMDARDEEITS